MAVQGEKQDAMGGLMQDATGGLDVSEGCGDGSGGGAVETVSQSGGDEEAGLHGVEAGAGSETLGRQAGTLGNLRRASRLGAAWAGTDARHVEEKAHLKGDMKL